jgi:hypothetical protein
VQTEGATSLAGWVDAQGRMVEATYPGGYVLRRTSYEEATENWRRGLGDGAATAPMPDDGPADAPAGLRPAR